MHRQTSVLFLFSNFEEATVAERERRGSSRRCFFRSGRPDTVLPSWSAYRHDNPFLLTAVGSLRHATRPWTAENGDSMHSMKMPW